jgi:hypothetical protein
MKETIDVQGVGKVMFFAQVFPVIRGPVELSKKLNIVFA